MNMLFISLLKYKFKKIVNKTVNTEHIQYVE